MTPTGNLWGKGISAMVAGLVIVAMLAGAFVAAVLLAMSMPFWVAILAYSLTGSVALIVLAALAGGKRRQRERSLAAQALAVPPRN